MCSATGLWPASHKYETLYTNVCAGYWGDLLCGGSYEVARLENPVCLCHHSSQHILQQTTEVSMHNSIKGVYTILFIILTWLCNSLCVFRKLSFSLHMYASTAVSCQKIGFNRYCCWNTSASMAQQGSKPFSWITKECIVSSNRVPAHSLDDSLLQAGWTDSDGAGRLLPPTWSWLVDCQRCLPLDGELYRETVKSHRIMGTSYHTCLNPLNVRVLRSVENTEGTLQRLELMGYTC